MHYSAAGIKGMHVGLLKEKLTVDINITADVGAAERVGNLAWHRLRKEGVIHDDLVCVPGDLLNYTSPFGPPGVRIDVGRVVRKIKEKEKTH